MEFKGQSAIEYLMTYGWMLLVVAIVGGLIFTLAQDQDVEEVTGFDGQAVIVSDFGVDTNDRLTLEVLNARRGTAEIHNVTVEGDRSVRYNDTGMELGSQEYKSVSIDGFATNDTAQQYSVSIEFDRGDLTGLSSSGGFAGGVRMIDE